MYLQIENSVIEDFAGKDIVLFGAGSCGLRMIEEFENIGSRILFVCDNNHALYGKELKGYKIVNPEYIKKHSELPVIISSTFGKEIKEQLNKMGITNSYKTKLGVHKDCIKKSEFANAFIEAENANKIFYDAILNDSPFFIGRLGSVEMECLCHYLYFLDRRNKSGKKYPPNVKMISNINAGFFPPEDDCLDEFAEQYLDDIKEMDIIWSRFLSKYENKIYSEFYSDKLITEYKYTCMPNLFELPWTAAFEGKKVLVIHPFEDSIHQNYKIKVKLFDNSNFLKDFELITYKPIQSFAGNKTEYNTWFEALNKMKSDIDKIDFDVALIAAGAYGLSLGAHVKRMGKKAFHVGGILQLYFGIRGKAWDKYNIHNEFWTFPLESERPEGFMKVEAGRYW